MTMALPRWTTNAPTARLLAIGAMTLAASLASADEPGARAGDDDRPVIGVEHKGPIKVVFQITTPETKEGVSKGLFYLNKLRDAYEADGFDPALLDIRGVFHDEGAVHLLTDAAWDRVRGETGGNPSAALLAELARKGVHVELCDTRRVSNGWAKSDVLLVKGAFQRIIDLQRQGYAYIRF